MQRTAVVIDINGVIADVRKPRAQKPPNRIPDAVTQRSGQSVYFRPGLSAFFAGLDELRKKQGVTVIIWTSRMAENSAAIEKAIFDTAGFKPDACLHGEDCVYKIGYYPAKDQGTVRRATGCGRSIFVDDNPGRIIGVSEYIPVPTYDALNQEETERTLQEVLSKLRKMIINTEHRR